jgi:feruloyl-CoA synthase
MDLVSMLESTARKFPAKDALVFGAERWTYRKLVETSTRAAAVLRDAGVRPGDRVAVMTYNTPGFVFGAFGTWRAGGVLVPVNHKFQAPEIAYTVGHSGSRVGIVDAGLADLVRKAAPDVRWLTTAAVDETVDASDDFDALVASAQAWEGVAVAETDPAQILYTSGTTSRPKGCVHTHRSMTTVPTYTSNAIPLLRSDRFLVAMPIWHASPLNNWFLSMMFLGGTVVLMREYHPVEFLETVQREKITAFFGAPIAYLAPLQVLGDLSSFDLSSVRAWIYGGSPIGADTARTLSAAYRSENFYQVYGMSEMGPVGTVLYPEEQVAKAGAIGHAGMPGVDIRVVADDGREAVAGEVGEIWVRSDTRMSGYLDDAEATAAAFEGTWYRSGDLARVDDDGYLFIVDRLKDVIITGGENVYSQEVEETLRAHPDIVDVGVIGRPHQDWGETVVAVVVVKEGRELSVEDVREWLAPRLARYKIPRELVVREEMPRTPSGKITKNVLRAALG